MAIDTSIRIVAPSLDLETAYQECEAEYNVNGEAFLGVAANDWPEYVARCDEEARGIVRDPARAPQSIFLLARYSATEGGEERVTLLGMAKLRHYLTPILEDLGGHIGYTIRPRERGKGYGSRILALTLERARQLGLSHVLLTCDTSNVRSARVIVRNGGVLTSEGYSALREARVSRYWIAL